MPQPIVAIQMNGLSQINIVTDTTFALGMEAQNRGYRLFVYAPEGLGYKGGGGAPSRIQARGHWATFQNHHDTFYVMGEETLLDLEQADVVLMRQDPPFNMAYIAATHLLELLSPSTRVINDPAGVRNAPEKLLVTYFPDLMPPTLMTWDLALIEDFIATHKSVVLKPLFEFGGNGIFLLHHNDPNLGALLEMYRRLYEGPPVFQKYLPEVAEGDKRIILIGGEPAGIFKRIPPSGNIRSNMRLGGTPELCGYTGRDLEICERLRGTLRERGLYLAGIDIIGNYLTEINVTSPTGLPVINQLYNMNLAEDFWEGLGARMRDDIDIKASASHNLAHQT